MPSSQFEVTTLGQPLEVLKTQMAANRSQSMLDAAKTVWSRGGIAGVYQGLIPWVSAYRRLLAAPEGKVRRRESARALLSVEHLALSDLSQEGLSTFLGWFVRTSQASEKAGCPSYPLFFVLTTVARVS